MDSLHKIYLEDSEDESTSTEIRLDSAYTSFTFSKTVSTTNLINQQGERYEVLFNDDPDKTVPCALCGRTSSNEEISGKIIENIGSEKREERKTIHLCKSCSELVQDKLTDKLREHYPTELAINKL